MEMIMIKCLSSLVLVLALASPLSAQDLTKVRQTADHLLRISVLIETTTSKGTGVVVKRGNDFFVVGNWHVVEGARSVREELFPDGHKKMFVDYTPIKVVRLTIRDGRTIGRVESECDLISYSDDDDGFDLVVLRVRDKAMFGEQDMASFYLDDEIPWVGMPLYHVGCLNGEEGYNSFTTGVVSQHGRIINKHVFDQVSITNFPGSSGGGVYLTDGRCIGLLTRRSGETFGYINPIREIRKWAVDHKIEWIFDSKKPVPPPKEVTALLEETIPIKRPAINQPPNIATGQVDIMSHLFKDILLTKPK